MRLLRLSAIAAFFFANLLAQSGTAPKASAHGSAAKVPAASASAAAQQANARRLMEQSIAQQKAAVAKQGAAVAAGGFFTVGWATPQLVPDPAPASVDCEPISQTEWEPLIAAAAAERQLAPALLRAVVRQESGFRACAVSAQGAVGLMQLMPETVARFHVADPLDPKQNIEAGAQYLKQLVDRYKGDLKSALAAYNAGPERVNGDPAEALKIPETQNYVSQILKEVDEAAPPKPQNTQSNP